MKNALLKLSGSAGSSGVVRNAHATKKLLVFEKSLKAHYPDIPRCIDYHRVLGLEVGWVSLHLQ
jgi:hypothetical protein